MNLGKQLNIAALLFTGMAAGTNLIVQNYGIMLAMIGLFFLNIYSFQVKVKAEEHED